MWTKISQIILRNRLAWLVAVALVTGFMAFMATKVQMRYQFGGLLPETDEAAIEHSQFMEQYGQDGSIIVLGMEADSLYRLDRFQAWKKLGDDLKAIPGIDSVFSLANLYRLRKSHEDTTFRPEPLISEVPTTQAGLDSLRAKIESYPFYENLLYNNSGSATLMMVFVNSDTFDSDARSSVMDAFFETTAKFDQDVYQLRYSGLPYIRSLITEKVKRELNMFIMLAAAVTGLILLIFFRSVKVMIFCMVVCGIAVTFSLGTIGIFGYEISMLMGLIPPLIIVIGIPNCVYLLNKYQAEMRTHGNKMKALQRVIRKVGNATFMTNTTTALGFATFIFVDSDILKEFGVIASVNIIGVFVLSILLVPIIFSYMPAPKERHTKHLEQRWLTTVVESLVNMATAHRKLVYLVTLVVVGASLYGVTLVQTTGNIVDDLPEDDKILVDLHWFEHEFSGVMPFEILVDTKEENKATGKNTLKKIEQLQSLLTEYPEFSKSLSIADAFKFAHQSYYNSNSPEQFRLPFERNDRQILLDLSRFIKKTAEKAKEAGAGGLTASFLDSINQTTRVTVQVADIGTYKMDSLITDVSPRIDSIFNPKRTYYDSVVAVLMSDSLDRAQRDSLIEEFVAGERRVRNFVKDAFHAIDDKYFDLFLEEPDSLYSFLQEDSTAQFIANVVDQQYYDITLTGTSVVYVKGTDYLVKNLFTSLVIAIIIIAFIMALLFRSVRMVVVSLMPNLIPLLFTAAIMGYFGISIKPSTILVFSIAFGISIDDTIHFLAKYRQELKSQEWNIKESVINALRETGVSMIYTSIILFFGFSMFGASTFGGIVALGVLVSVTLLVAMLANLVLLPSLLLSLEKSITTKSFNREPFLEILDEEEDIELEDLQVRRNDNPTPINTD